jgi:hypothetical protein
VPGQREGYGGVKVSKVQDDIYCRLSGGKEVRQMNVTKNPLKIQPDAASAFQAMSEDGERQVVGIVNLRVTLIHAGDYWTAQGLEIDYLAVGKSLEEAQHRFENGLSATISENLRLYGTIQPLLRFAPVDVLRRFMADQDKQMFKHSQVSQHDVESISLDYYRRAA